MPMPQQAGLKRPLKARGKGFNSQQMLYCRLPPTSSLLQLGWGGEGAGDDKQLRGG